MGLARWVQRQDRAGRIDPRPHQEPGLAERLGLSPAEAGRAVWVVEPGGRRYEGAGAISRTLRALGGLWALLGSFYLLRPFRWLEDAYYKRVSRRRAWW
ncbi:MAG: DUF393 domain-containing protein [Chloroflexi bacterium]|nr:MAG: DUF393 domain-containing protein [Chloroflexota bacterium]